MRWVRDLTGRFPKRPHYATTELDQACAELRQELGAVRQRSTASALSTDDLMVLIEQRTDDLDLYADLSAEGADVEAVTEFVPGQRPRVRIRRQLGEAERHAHRLRTTLAHELAHVVFHDFIWWFDQGTLDPPTASGLSPRCHRGRSGGQTDWLEWQAAYAAGALLMPFDALRLLLERTEQSGLFERSTAGREQVRRVQRIFDVSAEAARVRLLQLGYLSPRPAVVLAAPVPAAFKRSR